ncbi:MAG: anthranilate synthase component I family protein [Lachnospiraceae bacterium]|jgi:anthranilate synthase component 1|nr:anthranilate synthase component I family protein [Lachnospiraceae bacterium]
MTIDELKKFKEEGKYDIAPVSLEMLSDMRTPIQVLRILKAASDHCYLLESAKDNDNWGRYTFLGFDPKLEITCLNGRLKIGDEVVQTSNPAEHIRELLGKYRSPRISSLPPFTGGLVGYFAYDYIKYAEHSLHLTEADEQEFNDIDLMLFDKVIAFDHLKQKIILIVNIHLTSVEFEYERAQRELKRLKDLIENGKMSDDISGHVKGEFSSAMDKDEFCNMVEKAKHHIVEGDIFQIVLSNRLGADFEGSLLGAYRMLRTINPSPYMFYFCSKDLELAGASPETLVKLQDGVVHTFPLAGTRKRGADEEEDAELVKDLLADPKELAEHNMLVDLGRNDLGRISRFGTVKVEKLREVQFFSHVMHIGSTVRGEIREDEDALSAIGAVLPAGTLSGAPKIRACELIDELEGIKRGIYGGAIGYIDFTGNMDTCISIRLAYKKKGKVFVRSGAGIVADSVPENEFTECINKASAVIKAIHDSEEV